MKIGIGITSYKRPEHLELCLRQIYKHTFTSKVKEVIDKINNTSWYECDGVKYVIKEAKNIPNIAKAKNECLYALRDCDHIFLFDDDCFPIKDGWVDFFINSEVEHSLYLTSRHRYYSGIGIKVSFYHDCGGCFMYIRKDAFEKAGYFNLDYKQYGFEHVGYSNRIIKNELGTLYPCLIGTDQYLYSLDYQGEGNWGVKHKQSITDYKAIQESIDYNRGVFQKEITGDKIYYDYKP